MTKKWKPDLLKAPRTLFESGMSRVYVESFFDGTSRWCYIRCSVDGVKRPGSDTSIVVSQDELQEIIVAISKDAEKCLWAKNSQFKYDHDETDF